jgi:hypothetical protein
VGLLRLETAAELILPDFGFIEPFKNRLGRSMRRRKNVGLSASFSGY